MLMFHLNILLKFTKTVMIVKTTVYTLRRLHFSNFRIFYILVFCWKMFYNIAKIRDFIKGNHGIKAILT